MKTLIIKDLAVTAELDRNAMEAVRGGTGKGSMPSYVPSYTPSTSNFSFDASQLLSQCQDTQVNNGNNVAFSSGITANVNPTQCGHNNINFGH